MRVWAMRAHYLVVVNQYAGWHISVALTHSITITAIATLATTIGRIGLLGC
jgi:hypothetical protein